MVTCIPQQLKLITKNVKYRTHKPVLRILYVLIKIKLKTLN